MYLGTSCGFKRDLCAFSELKSYSIVCTLLHWIFGLGNYRLQAVTSVSHECFLSFFPLLSATLPSLEALLYMKGEKLQQP